MCYKFLSEFTIKEISNFNPNLDNRNAVICKRQDDTIIFHAIIQQSPLKDCQNEIIIYPTDDSFSKHTGNPMVCQTHENKSYEQLGCGDIMYKIL